MRDGRGGTVSRVMLCFALVGIGFVSGLSGCSFEFPEKEGQLAGCSDSSDCPEFESCSPVTSRCEVTAPPASSFTIEGPFACRLGDLTPAGAAFSVGWDAFESNGYGVTGGSGLVDHVCAAEVTDAGVGFAVRGMRHVNPTVGLVGFFYLMIQFNSSAYRFGEHHVITNAGALFFCASGYMPAGGWPPDSVNVSWKPDATGQCWQLFTVTEGDVQFTEAGSSTMRGYLKFRLDPSVFPPASSEE